MSFSFLMGIFACCISAFYTVNRFGFALEGAWCAIDRIYYDSLYGQLKDTEDRWDGIQNTKNILDNIYSFCKKLIDDTNGGKYWHGNATKIIENSNSIDDINKTRLELITSLYQLEESCNLIKNNSLKLNESDFERMGDVFLKDFDYYAKTLKACLKILPMIYYCILLIAVSAAVVSMMFYACLKRQGYLIIFMHVLWNIIRFFMFSFFLYGTAYGIGFLAIRDSIAVINRIFGENMSKNKDILGGGTDFLEYCLHNSDTNMLSEQNINAVKNFFSNIDNLMNDDDESFISLYNITCTDQPSVCTQLKSEVKEGGFKKSFDCGFLKSDLSHLYRTLSDASVESRILAALSLCSSFFGAVAVYFFLLVMHHYNNELFFDSGKSIFTGFDGFGGGYKKKVHEKDPAYKKRKLRAEVEMTSKNDEQSAYNNANKNEDGE